MTGRRDRIEIDSGSSICGAIFSPNSKHVVSGDDEEVRVWQVTDGMRVTAGTMRTRNTVLCLAISPDGRWIGAGTAGELLIWDAVTGKQVFWHNGDGSVYAIDFATDSKRFITGASGSASVWDIDTRQRVLLLPHGRAVIATKYSPQGDRIVIATSQHARVYDTINHWFLANIKVKVTSSYNNGLLWSDDHLLVISDGKIKQFEASKGSLVSEWPVRGSDEFSCISLPKNGEFIAYSAKRTVTIWDTATHTQLSLIEHPQDIRSIAFSLDDQYLAIGGKDGKIIIESLSRITASTRKQAPALSGRNDKILDSKEEARQLRSQPRIADPTSSSRLASPESTPSIIIECPFEIDAIYNVYAICFSTDGKRLVSGRSDDIQVLQAENGIQVATMRSKSTVSCLAVSRNGKWIGVGTEGGEFFVWDPEMRKQSFSHNAGDPVYAVDFSSDSKQFVTGSVGSASVWDIGTRQRVLLLYQDAAVIAAKHSPNGDRMAIATWKGCVRVYDNINRQFLLDIDAEVISPYNNGLLWSDDDHLLIISHGKVKQFEASTGSLIKEWPAPDTGFYSCISLPKHGQFVVYSTKRTVRIWDMSTYDQLRLIEHSQDIRSIAVSPDDWYLAIGGEKGKIVIESLPRIKASTPVRERQDQQSSKSGRRDGGRYGSAKLGIQSILPPRTPDPPRRQLSSSEYADLGDKAMDAQRQDEAISHYTTALSLKPPSPHGILVKRGKAFLATGSCRQALDDANQAIKLDPSSPWGYELKHAALHKAGKYGDAVAAFEAMLSEMAGSPDPDIQQYGDQYISPSSTRATIQKIVQQTIRRLPRVLLNTTTGRLHSKAEQASAFESLPIFNELVSSMTKRTDYVRIKQEVRQYYRYAMLSHKWEENEPLFEQVTRVAVYDLDKSPTHDKLQMFCKIAQSAGFHWAWSDTCCINKSDHFVLQEALVAMFKWYQNSSMTIVFLRGVRSSSRLGALVKSVWNTRAWTLQEYVAAKVVHFYTEDWTLYLNLKLPNHKESREVISEMEKATGVSAEQLLALRPGLTSIREKLRLASTRQTTLVEDAAYSLLGIFSVTGLPAIYGEGDGSLGRLLSHVLAVSGDVSILAWAGESGSFNSCLPSNIAVFDKPTTTHLPKPIPDPEMDKIVNASRTSSFDLDVALSLYDRLSELPSPWFAASRMKLPCIAFQLPPLSPFRARSGRVYRAETSAFGMVEITTRHDLTRMKSLYLVHPWLDGLMEQEDTHGGEDDIGPSEPNTDGIGLSDEEVDDDDDDDPMPVPESELSPRTAREDVVPMSRETRARRLVARLKQPFGALLLAPAASGRRVTDYKRVAADSTITVRFQKNVSLADIMDNVRTLDVL